MSNAIAYPATIKDSATRRAVDGLIRKAPIETGSIQDADARRVVKALDSKRRLGRNVAVPATGMIKDAELRRILQQLKNNS